MSVVAIIMVLVVLVGVSAYLAVGARNIRLQDRALAAVRESGVGYSCLPELGQTGPGMWLLSVGHDEVTIRPGWRSKPGRMVTMPRAGVTVNRVPVQVNVARTVDGVELTATDGHSVKLVLYPDPTFGVSQPMSDFELDYAIWDLRRSIASA